MRTLTFCQGSHYLAVASDSGAVQLLGIEASKLPKSPKIHPLQSRYVCLSQSLHFVYGECVGLSLALALSFRTWRASYVVLGFGFDSP